MPLVRKTFTTLGSNTLVVPNGVKYMWLRGCGGGGGGAGGAAGNTSTAQRANGGGGGGGAPLVSMQITVSPGETLTLFVGDGGAGGAAGSDGSTGVNSIVSGSVTGSIATLYGAGGGRQSSITTYGVSTGGGPEGPDLGYDEAGLQAAHGEGGGSAGTGGAGSFQYLYAAAHRSYAAIHKGTSASGNFVAKGTTGTDSGSKLGGVGGGGGGYGPFGDAGGAGGAGGAGSAAAGSGGTVGADAAANTGAGGGGGGGGGEGTSGGAGAAGGKGGSGIITLEWYE